MTSILIDTHVWAWSLFDRARLSTDVLATIVDAEQVFLSPLSFYEIGQKVRLGKWPQMEQWLKELGPLSQAQGLRVAPPDQNVCLTAAGLAWSHRDPFDRLLAATAMSLGIPFVSADAVFDELQADPRWTGRIW